MNGKKRMKHIVITGASRGIGRSIAMNLAAEGVKLYLIGRDIDTLSETLFLVQRRGADAEIITGDIAYTESIHEVAARLKGQTVHALINNAGTTYVVDLEDIDIDKWQGVMDLNVTAPMYLTQKLSDNFAEGSSVVNILSVAATTGFPGWIAYCASKSALAGFSRALREEWRPRGIRVIDIYPAATATDLWDSVPGDWPRAKMMSPDEVGKAVAYALDQPGHVVVESITVGGIGGNL